MQSAHLKCYRIIYGPPASIAGGQRALPKDVEPPERGRVVAQPTVDGLHHRYFRRADDQLRSELKVATSAATFTTGRARRCSPKIARKSRLFRL